MRVEIAKLLYPVGFVKILVLQEWGSGGKLGGCFKVKL